MNQHHMTRKILGESQPIKDLIKMIHKVAQAKTNILVIGESGTGKELVARMIHESGVLKGKPFVPVNCGAIPENLIESELFGHKKGSFTGAVSDKAGLFEVANGGTLFLDEVGELPLGMQVKILRAIQERSFRRVGGNEDVKVDVRIIAATNRDLEQAVHKGTFREDLYYRLNVILIKTPSLRDRKEDISLLSKAFLERCLEKLKGVGQSRPFTDFHPETLKALELHSWPGNVRELENVIERAVTLETGKALSLSSLPATIVQLIGQQPDLNQSTSKKTSLPEIKVDFFEGPISLKEVLSEIEKKYIEAALRFTGGDETNAYELLGIKPEKSPKQKTQKKKAASAKKPKK